LSRKSGSAMPQFGRNTDGHVVQNGYGRAGASFQIGW
jgi:hypothetical protein